MYLVFNHEYCTISYSICQITFIDFERKYIIIVRQKKMIFELDKLVYAYSTVSDGNMSLNWGEKNEVEQNRVKFLRSCGMNVEDTVKASLVHGVEIKHVDRNDCGKELTCDSLITSDPAVIICMVTADCFPLILYDRVNQVVSLSHLGHRGVTAKLAQKVVNKMHDMGANLAQTIAIIGPGITKESYVFEQVSQINDKNWQPFLTKLPDGQIAIDLPGYITSQLTTGGIKKENIIDLSINTAIDLRFFSHYRSIKNGESEARFLSAVQIRE